MLFNGSILDDYFYARDGDCPVDNEGHKLTIVEKNERIILPKLIWRNENY